ncbi:MAG: hypothetical protein ABI873_19845 [Marmoricola sp.]
MRWLIVLLLGGGLGVVAAASDAGIGLDPSPTVRVLSILAGLGTVWAGAAVLGGWLLAKAPWSVLAGPLVLVAAAIGYYAWGAMYGDQLDLGFGNLSDRAQLWVVAGVLMGPVLGLVGGVARTNDLAGIAARILVPLGLATEIVVRYPLRSAEYGLDPLLAWTSTCLLVVGVLGALIAMVSGQTSSSQ